MKVRYRSARPRDLERLCAIHLAAYPDERGHAARQRNFTHAAFGRLADLVVAEDGGEVVAHGFLFPLEAMFGQHVPAGGIASVAVAPEARGRGVATELLGELHRRAHRRGDALTMLYAFRQGFYRRLGYVPTAPRKRLAIDTRAIPWRDPRVRAATGSDRAAIERLHRRALPTGGIARTRRFWDKHLSDERRFFFVVPGGFVSFRVVQEQPNAETVLEVDDLVSERPAARRAILGALGAMRDQASEAIVELSLGDPLDRVLVDVDGRRHGTAAVPHALGEIVAGPMVRIEDVERAVVARGYMHDARFDLEVDGETRGVRVSSGRARIVRPGAGPRIATDRAGLAAILYGGVALDDACDAGLATADAPGLGAALALAPHGPSDPF